MQDERHGYHRAADADHRSPLAAISGLLLVAALVGSIVWAWQDPSSQGRYRVKEAGDLLRQGRYLYAASILENTLTSYDSPQARLNLSYAYLARRDADRAERQARRVLETAPSGFHSAAWAQLGRVLAYEGQTDLSLSAWKQAIATEVDTSGRLAGSPARSAVWHIAITEWNRADWVSARSNLEALLAKQDSYSQAAMLKLAQLVAPDDPTRSLSLLTDLGKTARNNDEGPGISSDPSQPIPDLRVPGLEEGLPRDQALVQATALRRAHEQIAGERKSGADAARIADLWGTFYLQQGEIRLAQRYLEQSLSLAPNSADAHARLGAAMLKLGNEAGALTHLQRAVSLDGKQPLAHSILAQLYTGKREWAKADEEFSALRSQQPDGVELHVQLAEYYTLRGQYQEAEDEYIDAATSQRLSQSQAQGQQQEGSIDAMLALALFYTDVRGPGCEKGLPAATESLASHPGNPASLEAVGWSLFLCRKPKDALSSLEHAVNSAPNVPRYHYHLARTYAQLGRLHEARDQYTWVRDLDPGGVWEQLAVSDMVTLPPEK